VMPSLGDDWKAAAAAEVRANNPHGCRGQANHASSAQSGSHNNVDFGARAMTHLLMMTAERIVQQQRRWRLDFFVPLGPGAAANLQSADAAAAVQHGRLPQLQRGELPLRYTMCSNMHGGQLHISCEPGSCTPPPPQGRQLARPRRAISRARCQETTLAAAAHKIRLIYTIRCARRSTSAPVPPRC